MGWSPVDRVESNTTLTFTTFRNWVPRERKVSRLLYSPDDQHVGNCDRLFYNYINIWISPVGVFVPKELKNKII